MRWFGPLRHGLLSLVLPLLTFEAASIQQFAVPRLELLPDLPAPYRMRDWRRTALYFDALLFDANARGPYLPLSWRLPDGGIGMPSYVGQESARGKPGEAITLLGAMLGATSVGIDKRRWLDASLDYLSDGLVLNNVGGRTGQSFWYELLPSLHFVQLASRYPAWTRGVEASKGIADRWVEGMEALGGNFDHTSLDFRTMMPVDNGRWKEPDAAAGVAYLELFQFLRSGEPKYLAAARRALLSLQKRTDNPQYEVLMPYGALAASYLNAEKGEHWDVPRFVDWCFDPSSPFRPGWGMVGGQWGGFDVGGLMGSTLDHGGYAFAMNSFLTPAILLPLARYDDRFSVALARYALNVANAARLFYSDALPKKSQSSGNWSGDSRRCVAYEALRKVSDKGSPFASGDAQAAGWAKTDFGLYGSGYVGLLAALARPTGTPMILRLDLRATDFLATQAYPTSLYWNPYSTVKTVKIDLGRTPVRLYDAVKNRFLRAKPCSGEYDLRLAARQAVQLVLVPARGPIMYSKNRTLVRGVPIDFNNGRVPLPPRVPVNRTDRSVSVSVARKLERSGTIALAAGSMRADLRFTWNERGLQFRIDQRATSTKTVEAPSDAAMKRQWWDYEAIVLEFDPGRDRFAVATVPEVVLGWSSTPGPAPAFSPDLPVSVRASGSAKAANRRLEGEIAWADLRRACGVKRPWEGFVRIGAKIGCQPLTVDGTFRRQAYVGGSQYNRPSGFDDRSRTLVLVP